MLYKALALILALLLYNTLFFHFLPNPGTTGFLLLTAAGQAFIVLAFLPKYAAFLRHAAGKQLTSPIGLAALAQTLALAAAALALFKGSPVDQVILVWTNLGLTAAALYLAALEHSTFGAASEAILIPASLATHYFSSPINALDRSLPRLVALLKKGPKPPKLQNDLVSHLIRGAIITVPIVVIVTVLLTTADPVFNKFIENLLNIKLPHITLSQRLAGSLILTAFLTPITLLSIRRVFSSPLNHPSHSQGGFELTMLTASLAFILGTFIIIQFRYLFASVPETELSQFGVATYSQYVRRGFSELTLVSIIVYLAAGLSFIIHRAKQHQPLLQQRVNLLLLAEIAVFIVSIFRRVFLYANSHGLTRSRVYGSAFLLVLLALTLILIARQLARRPRPWYLLEIAAVLAGIFIITNLGVDQLIASRFPPHVNQETDYIYLSRLSSDTPQAWIEAYNWAKATVTDPALQGKTKIQDFTDDQIRHFLYAEHIITNTNIRFEHLKTDLGGDNRNQNLNLNLQNQTAYLKLTQTISQDNIKAIYDQARFFYNLIPSDQVYRYYDRSLNSPLID